MELGKAWTFLKLVYNNMEGNNKDMHRGFTYAEIVREVIQHFFGGLKQSMDSIHIVKIKSVIYNSSCAV